jgi:hypothetical protein
MKIQNYAVAFAFVLAAVSLQPAHAQAAPPAGNPDQIMATVLNLIRALVDQGVISAAKAQDMLRQAGLDPALLNAPQVSRVAPQGEAAAPVVRVPYVPETVKDEIRDEVKQEVLAQAKAERWGEPGALPDWISRLTVFGDMRIRYQREDYPGDNSAPLSIDAWYQLPTGTTKDTETSREQEVVRARVGMEAQMGENFRAQIRVVAVNGDTLTASPVTYNVDEASYGRPFSAGIDLANIQWQPVPAATATLGRMLNPYLGTDLVFANDLSFDGIVAHVEPHLTNAWSAFFTAGMHPLTSNWVGPYNSASNQWLYAGQLGGKWRAADESALDLAATYYDYVALEGQLNPVGIAGNTLNSDSAPPFRILGNTMFNINWYSDPNGTPAYAYASKFRLADAYLKYDLARFDPMRLGFSAEYVKNVGFNANEIERRIQGAVQGLPLDNNGLNSLQKARTKGYRVEFDIGNGTLNRFGSWQFFAGYRYLERDSVPDAFTSLDYRLGGTDQKATFVGAKYALSSRVNARLSLQSAKSIDAPIKYDIDMWFIDLYGNF